MCCLAGGMTPNYLFQSTHVAPGKAPHFAQREREQMRCLRTGQTTILVWLFSQRYVQAASLLPAPVVKGETTRNARGISKHSEMGKESRQERVIIITEREAKVTCLLELIGLQDAEMMPKRSGHCAGGGRAKG